MELRNTLNFIPVIVGSILFSLNINSTKILELFIAGLGLFLMFEFIAFFIIQEVCAYLNTIYNQSFQMDAQAKRQPLHH
ncbi:MAG: hypothetical protein ACFFG0_05435 [Candidatus Thorarchaeota archaeon]